MVLADDHPKLRRSLRAVLEHERDVQVVGETADIGATLQELREDQPHVVVVDLGMPNPAEEGTVDMLRRLAPGTEVVVVTMYDSARFAQHALGAGALGFVVTDRADTELADAVHCAARGESYVSPRVRSGPLL